jgi:hypothetical protein
MLAMALEALWLARLWLLRPLLAHLTPPSDPPTRSKRMAVRSCSPPRWLLPHSSLLPQSHPLAHGAA